MIRLSYADLLASQFTTAAEDIDINDVLARHRMIAVPLYIDDVKHIRPDLDDNQCWEVLQHCRRKLEGAAGLSDDMIGEAAHLLFGSVPAEADEMEALWA